MHADGQHLHTSEGRMWLEAEEDGECVIVVGGGPGTGHAHYHPWFSALAARFRVVYFDYFGTGRSDRLEHRAAYTIHRFAGQVEAIREHLRVARVSLIGVSFGGMPALRYALDRPGRVRRLVLSNAQISARSWQEHQIDAVNRALRTHFPERWDQLLRLRERGTSSLDPAYQALYGEVLDRLEWADPADHPALRHDEHNALEPEVYAAVVGDDPEWRVSGTMSGFDPRPELARLRVPTLLATGRWDGLTPPCLAHAAASWLPPGTADVVVFERSAHRPWAEESEDYMRTVGDFMAAW